jgi:hypothetical protein
MAPDTATKLMGTTDWRVNGVFSLIGLRLGRSTKFSAPKEEEGGAVMIGLGLARLIQEPLLAWYIDQLVGRGSFQPAHQKGFLCASWFTNHLIRRNPLLTSWYTSLLEGVPSNELVYRPACQKGFFPTSWYANQLTGWNPSQRAGMQTGSPGGNPPNKLCPLEGFPSGGQGCTVSWPGGTPPSLKTVQSFGAERGSSQPWVLFFFSTASTLQ